MYTLLCYNISTDKELVNNMKEYQVDVYNVNNELVYEEKNMTCNDEQFDTFIRLLTNELVYGKKGSW